MKIGEVYRYVRLTDAKKELVARGSLRATVDGLPNFLKLTLAPDGTLTGLEAGINPVRKIASPEGPRVPAILVRSSPHKVGSETTPWQDHFAPDIGLVRFYGDAKPGQTKPPENVTGNRVLLDQFSLHSAPDEDCRHRASPVLLFQSVPADGRTKGQVKFQGLAVISGARRVVQWDPRSETSFTNYRFDFTVLDLSHENEQFDWGWINARRDPTLSSEQTHRRAPASWRRWTKEGIDGLPSLRRRVAKLLTLRRHEQLPAEGTRSERVLNDVYHHYDDRKHRFEALAEVVVERVISDSGADYRRGWITPASSDGGADFVGRVDIGSGFARTKLVVLGQAKCISPRSGVGAKDLARVVARLRRGWLGAFVTTAHYSLAAQREAIEDSYPIILVNGLELADTVQRLAHEAGTVDVETFLRGIDRSYRHRVEARSPEEVLLEA